MTQQSSVSSRGAASPGQMTAVMRAVASSGPRVLRIGLVQDGRVMEERIVKERTNVTVGSGDNNTFVVSGKGMPTHHLLFELVGGKYFLKFDDEMTGRLAAASGLLTLAELRAAAEPAKGGVYRYVLTEESRGKVIVGETTFLFQFVAPPPLQPRPQLPVSVTRGGSNVDWPTTVIAAVSFLFHFCAIGAIYSDWLDPIVDYDVNITALVETVRSLPTPPPVEEKPEDEKKEEDKPKKAEAPKLKKSAPKLNKPAPTKPQAKQHVTKAEVAAITNELESLEMATLAALSGIGPATENVLRSGEVPTSALDAAAKSEAGVSSAGPGGLKLGGSGGAIRPGAVGGGLASIGKTGKSATAGSGKQKKVRGPRGNASLGNTSVAGGKVSNASRVVARMRAGFRACYNRGLQNNPDIEGKIMLKIQIGPTGQVLKVTAKKKGNIPAAVLGCLKARAKAARFGAPDGGMAVVKVPVTFVKQ